MEENGVYTDLFEVLNDKKFAEVDCLLRTGRHIGQEDLTAYTFLIEAAAFLNIFYRRYDCQLVRANQEVGDYFFLSSYGSLLGQRQISVPAMKVGIALGFMVSDPEYMDRRIPVSRLVSTLKMLLGEDRFLTDFAPRKKGSNADLDEGRAYKAVEKAARQLNDLGFVNYSKRGTDTIVVLSPIYRFLEPMRGVGRLEDALRRLIIEGVVDEYEDENEDVGDDDEDEL